MAPFLSLASAALLLISGTQAHFQIRYPTTTVAAFDDAAEGTGPCGVSKSFDLDSLNTTDFHVGGDAIATWSSHTESKWLYRLTTDKTASSGNWTQIYNIIHQTGPQVFCAPQVTVDESYVGKKGIISIVDDASDGFLYQCVAVKFVSGKNSNKPSACTNSSQVSGSFTTDSKLSALVGTDVSSSSSSTASSSGSSSSAASGTYGSAEGVFTLLVAGAMAALGGALLV